MAKGSGESYQADGAAHSHALRERGLDFQHLRPRRRVRGAIHMVLSRAGQERATAVREVSKARPNLLTDVKRWSQGASRLGSGSAFDA